MKVLLVNPPTDHAMKVRGPNLLWYQHPHAPPLGLLSISSYLKQQGYSEVKLINGQVPRPPSDAEITAQIRSWRPEIAGISSSTLYYYDSIRMAKLIREASPETKIVFGGPQPTLYPVETVARPEVDFGVMGEGEYTFVELARALESGGGVAGIEGLVWERDGEPVINDPRRFPEPLDALPTPDYSLVDITHHRVKLEQTGPTAAMVSSRGCPFRCTFCGQLYRYYRALSAERVVDDMVELHRRGYRAVSFGDDNFSLQRSRVMEICEQIGRRGLEMVWSYRGRVDRFDDELVAAMYRAGMRRVSFGVESGCQEVIDGLKKNFTLEQVREAVRVARRHRVTSLAYMMVSLPGETREQIQQTIRFIFELDPDYVVLCQYMPMPGSILYDEMVARGEFHDYARDHSRDPRPDLGIQHWDRDVPERETFRMMRNAYLRFYLHPAKFIATIGRGRSLEDFSTKVRTGADAFRRLLTCMSG